MQSTLRQIIIDAQQQDPSLMEIRREVESGQMEEFSVSLDLGLQCVGRLCVPEVDELKNEILE